jgi:hypothetical protein
MLHPARLRLAARQQDAAAIHAWRCMLDRI